MARLSQAQQEARRRIDWLATRDLPPEDLASRLLEAIAPAIPSFGQRFFGVDPSTLLFNRLLAASESDHPVRLGWLRDVYLQGDPRFAFVEFPNLMRAGLSVVSLSGRAEAIHGFPPRLIDHLQPVDWYEWWRSDESPAGGAIFTPFQADHRWVGGLILYRRDEGRPFRSGDVAFMRLISPTIGQAIAAALRRERARTTRNGETDDTSGILLLDSRGRLSYRSPAGEHWCALMADAERDSHAPLPTAVWSAISGLQLIERQASPLARSRLVVPTAAGPVRIEASRGGDDGSVAVVVTPERPPAAPPIPPEWPLTPSELQVVGHLLRGLPNGGIAEQLYISEATVRTHLLHVYDKLGVGSRTELLGRLFNEAYLPETAALTP